MQEMSALKSEFFGVICGHLLFPADQLESIVHEVDGLCFQYINNSLYVA